MIGQRELLKKIDGQIERGKFPKVSILIGEKGSGKQTLASHIIQKLDCVPVPTSRYLFPSADRFPDKSLQEVITLIENSPCNTYIILTCESIDKIPMQIQSKAVKYMMENYSYEDKCDYLRLNKIDNLTADQEEFILETATNIGEVKEMCSMDIDSLRRSVRNMLDALKTNEDISKIAFREGDDRLPLHILWKAFTTACGEQIQKNNNSLIYCRLIAITGDYLQDLPTTEDTRDLFNSWLMAIEDEWITFNA